MITSVSLVDWKIEPRRFSAARKVTTSIRRRAVVTGYVAAVTVAVALMAERDRLVGWPIAVLWALALWFGLLASHALPVEAGAIDRRRMQWVGWALAVGPRPPSSPSRCDLIADWPPSASASRSATTVLVPSPWSPAPCDVVAASTACSPTPSSLAGLTAVVIRGLRRHRHRSRSRPVETTSARCCCCRWSPPGCRRCCTCPRAAARPSGPTGSSTASAVAPDEPLRTFGTRLTSAIPMDELLLQLVESLRKTMVLPRPRSGRAATAARARRCGARPRRRRRSPIGAKERAVVARAGFGRHVARRLVAAGRGSTVGTTAARRADHPLRRAARADRRQPPRRRRRRSPRRTTACSTELARQVGLALHNVQLDSALQASLDELRRRNDELQRVPRPHRRRRRRRAAQDRAQPARRRPAAPRRAGGEAAARRGRWSRTTRRTRSDARRAPRRRAGHDRRAARAGARHLPAAADVRRPRRGAAGGRRPRRAADRRSRPTASAATAAEIEAAVYFCCLEAMQNAGKHAGDERRRSRVRVVEGDGLVASRSPTTAPGSTPRPSARPGHGFVNMSDRLGAIGGTLEVTSAPGAGTTVPAAIPLADRDAPAADVSGTCTGCVRRRVATRSPQDRRPAAKLVLVDVGGRAARARRRRQVVEAVRRQQDHQVVGAGRR